MSNAGQNDLSAAGAFTTTTTRTGISGLALISTFAALIAVLALTPAVTVAGMAVPITLQTLGVMLAGAVLGARRGALATVLYILVGLAGVPIFAQFTGGLSVLAAPSAGYLLTFPLAAFLIGPIASRFPGPAKHLPAIGRLSAHLPTRRIFDRPYCQPGPGPGQGFTRAGNVRGSRRRCGQRLPRRYCGHGLANRNDLQRGVHG